MNCCWIKSKYTLSIVYANWELKADSLWTELPDIVIWALYLGYMCTSALGGPILSSVPQIIVTDRRTHWKRRPCPYATTVCFFFVLFFWVCRQVLFANIINITVCEINTCSSSAVGHSFSQSQRGIFSRWYLDTCIIIYYAHF